MEFANSSVRKNCPQGADDSYQTKNVGAVDSHEASDCF
jgi:hypothetical protein